MMMMMSDIDSVWKNSLQFIIFLISIIFYTVLLSEFFYATIISDIISNMNKYF